MYAARVYDSAIGTTHVLLTTPSALKQIRSLPGASGPGAFGQVAQAAAAV
jgi:hypothetical protein